MLKEVKIELTNRCFRNCKHCSSSATNSSNNVKELDFEDVKKIIYQAKDMNIWKDVIGTIKKDIKA